jgi:hypothetical protein
MERAAPDIPVTPIELFAYGVIGAMIVALVALGVWLLWPFFTRRAPDLEDTTRPLPRSQPRPPAGIPGTVYGWRTEPQRPPEGRAPAPQPVWLTPEQRAAAKLAERVNERIRNRPPDTANKRRHRRWTDEQDGR